MPQYQGVWSLQQQMQALTSGQWATDPNFKNTTLLLQGDGGANGAQNNTFYDSSTNAFAITRNGNTTQGSFSPFSNQPGAWGVYLNASSELNAGSNAALAFGTGAYTVEMWVYPLVASTSYSAGNGPCLFFNDTTNGFGFWDASSSGLTISVRAGSDVLGSTTHLVPNQWNHVVAVRGSTASNQTSIFLNGVRVANGTDATNWTITGPAKIGGISLANYYLNGYVSNTRVVKGTAVYDPTQTTLVIPNAPLSAITNTSLLTCQSNRFIDNSANAFAITVNGTPSVQPFSPFAPQYQWTSDVIGGSGYFDGTGDYLSVSGGITNAGTGDMCLEFFAYWTGGSFNDYKFAFDSRTSAGSFTDGVSIAANTSTGAWYVSWIGQEIVGTAKAGAYWNHVCLTRQSGVFRFFVDGVLQGTYTQSTWNFNSTTNRIGSYYGATTSYQWTGYIAGLRATKSSVPTTYQTSSTTVGAVIFTPPSAPVTTTSQGASGTSFLTNFTNAGIYDGTMKNCFETVGNAQISTSVVKYGSGSMYFDGSGDYLSIPASKFWYIGTGDYTIEAWIYPTAWGDILSCFNTSSPYSGWNLQTGGATGGSPNGVMNMFISNGTTSADYNATTVMSLNRWTHIAVVKSGTTLYQFINGVLDKTSTGILTPADSNNVLLVGISNLLARPYTGYIDDLRITKGIARYMQSFIPPSVALPRQ